LQRVGYRVDQDGLWRDHWLVLDRTLATQPVRRRLLDEVRNVRFRYMTPSRDWVERWPSSGGTGGGQAADPASLRQRPIAVEVVLELEDWGEIRRVVEVADERSRQRGVALITAVLIAAPGTIPAIKIAFRASRPASRSLIWGFDQGSGGAGRQAWAADFPSRTKTDHLAEIWARPLPRCRSMAVPCRRLRCRPVQSNSLVNGDGIHFQRLRV
jgi:hypothetical protein